MRPLAIGPRGTLYAADSQAAKIYALDVSAVPDGAQGTKDIPSLDARIAATLGTASSEITITDLKVDPATHNSYVAVVRGQGAGAAPALFRVDGAGALIAIPLTEVKFSSVALPNAPDATPAGGKSNRSQSITKLAYSDDKVWIAGLSNEEFASKLQERE